MSLSVQQCSSSHDQPKERSPNITLHVFYRTAAPKTLQDLDGPTIGRVILAIQLSKWVSPGPVETQLPGHGAATVIFYLACIHQGQADDAPAEKVMRTAQGRIQNREVYFTLSVQENNCHKPVQNVQQNQQACLSSESPNWWFPLLFFRWAGQVPHGLVLAGLDSHHRQKHSTNL